MANKRVLVKRRKSVRNIRKITRTMQLIATARFQAALNRATASKPYTEKLAELVAELSSDAERIDHPLLQVREAVHNTSLIVITSNRGLCGGYNAHVLRSAVEHLDNAAAREIDVDVHMVGRKGAAYFRFLGRAMAERRSDIDDKPRFADVEPMANALIDRFVRGEIDEVHVAYVKFHSVGKQTAVVMPLLPLARGDADGAESTPGVASKHEFEFSPPPQALLDELLPATVRVRLFQCFVDAVVSEQIARMVAMKAATDAAEDMIAALSRAYNRARQTQITMELLDIVGGANALA